MGKTKEKKNMKAEDLAIIKNRLQVLPGLPLRCVRRLDGFVNEVLCLDLGELVVCGTQLRIYKDDDEKIKAGKKPVGEYTLALSSAYRITYGDEIVLARYDHFFPSTEIVEKAKAEGRVADWEDDNFDKVGNNKLDEVIFSRFQSLDSFVVESIDVNQFGDLVLKFANGFTLEAFSDCSQGEYERWRFWREGDATDLVITGAGIEPQDDEDSPQENAVI